MLVKDIIINLNHNKIKLLGINKECQLVSESKVMDDIECIIYTNDRKIMLNTVSFITVSNDIVYIYYEMEVNNNEAD